MSGKHRVGRHRRRPPVARRLMMVGSVVTAIIVLTFAFIRPTQRVSDPHPSPVTPVLDLTIPTTTTTVQPTPTTTSKKKKKKSQKTETSLSPSKSMIEKDALPPLPTEINSTPRAAQAAVAVIPTTPRPPPSPTSTKIHSSIPTTSPLTTKRTTVSKVTVIPRVVPSTTTPSKPKPTPKPNSKPTTIVPVPSPKPVVTNNPKCGTIGLLPQPRAACNRILAAFPQITSVLGVGARAGNPTSCHPQGLAIDFIVGTNKALGDRIFAFATSNRVSLGASPVILWQVPDHFDHVHISFEPCKG